MSMQFFKRQETVVVSVFLGDRRHERRTKAHLLGRCNNEPVKVLEFFRNHVTREDFEDNEILRKIAMGLRKEGFGDKIRFKPPVPVGKQLKDPAIPQKTSLIEKIKELSYSDILEKRGLVKYAAQAFA